MLLQVAIERHRLHDHLMVQFRGIQQVKPVVLPYCKTQMDYIKPRLVAGDGNDVTVVDGLAQQLGVAYGRLGDITELHAAEVLFSLVDAAYEFRMFLQCLIALGMRAHIIDADFLDSRENSLRLLDLCNES